MNTIENMTLNIAAADAETCQNLERSLYSFARNTLLDVLDRTLSEMDFDDDLVLDSLALDMGEVSADNALEQFAEKLPAALKSSLSKAVFKKRSRPTLNMLAETYRNLLPMNQVMNIEKEFDHYAEEWLARHPDSKYDALAVSEYIIKMMMQRFPGLDSRQIAYSVYQKVKNMEARTAKRAVPMESANDVHDSGLVLLSPYIPMLFCRFGCVAGNTFTSDEARLKGLALLKFAVYGNYDVPKTQASLMNMVCGLDRTYNAEKLPTLSDDDKAVVNSLLEAVVKNWGSLGSTTADGLRSSFLIRPGHLEDAEDGLLLKVAPSPFDMLLDKLPWGYSTIKFPWIKSIINVKWR